MLKTSTIWPGPCIWGFKILYVANAWASLEVDNGIILPDFKIFRTSVHFYGGLSSNFVVVSLTCSLII